MSYRAADGQRIDTDRLVVSTSRVSDTEALFPIVSDPRHIYVRRPATLDELRSEIAAATTQPAVPCLLHFSVRHREDDVFIGVTEVVLSERSRIDKPGPIEHVPTVELRIVLTPDRQAQGFANEIGTALLRVLNHDGALMQQVAFIRPGNVHSAEVAKKAGFHKDGFDENGQDIWYRWLDGPMPSESSAGD